MIQYVLKRDGRVEAFDSTKILNAVRKASIACKGVGCFVYNPCQLLEWVKSSDEIVTVDYIHNQVVEALKESNSHIAKQYKSYLEGKEIKRLQNSNLMKDVGKIVHKMHNGNANTQNSSASKMYGIAEECSKRYFLAGQPELYQKYHNKGIIYQHDLAYYGLTWNCFFNPIGKMLREGFSNGIGTIRPPKRLQSAVELVCIILQSSQNSMFGGQGILRFDYDLAPFVKLEYDRFLNRYEGDHGKALEETNKLAYQCMEALVYNLNTMRSRTGSQVTFSSVNFGTDTSTEGRLISINLLKAFMAGLGHGENPIFPNLCYKLKSGINLYPNDKNYDITQLAVECCTKRIQPRFVFCDSPAYEGMPIENIGAMGCRSAIRKDVNTTSNNDTEARGNLFFHTINLPYLALESRGAMTTTRFKKRLSEVIDITIDTLLFRYNTIKNLKCKDVPFVSEWWQGGDGLEENDTVEKLIKHGSIAVGFIGLADCLKILTGKHHGENKNSQVLGLEIIQMIRDKTDKATEKYHLNFATFATPAESACFTLRNKIVDEFGIIEGVTDKKYLTNSFHVPVFEQCDLKTKLDIEAPYHLLCNGGAIFYEEIGGGAGNNKNAIIKLLQNIAKSGVVYGGFNFQHNFCKKCGKQFTTDNNDNPHCPACGSDEVVVTRIITGYLSTLDKFNVGKVAESNDRVNHDGYKSFL